VSTMDQGWHHQGLCCQNSRYRARAPWGGVSTIFRIGLLTGWRGPQAGWWIQARRPC
jgi:hypothetical protein